MASFKGLWRHGSALALALMVVLAMIYIVLIVRTDLSARAEKSVGEVRNALDTFAAATQSYFLNYDAAVAVLAQSDCVLSRGETGCDGLFPRVNRQFPTVVNFAALGKDGRFFASGQAFPASGPPDGSKFSFFTALARGDKDVYIMDPHKGPISGELVLGFTKPLRDTEGHFDGAIGVSLKFGELDEIWQRVRQGEDAGAAIFDRAGRLIFASADAQWVRDLEPNEQESLYQQAMTRQGVFVVGQSHSSHIFMSETVAGGDWLLVVLHPGPYGMVDYLHDTTVLPKLLMLTLALAALALGLCYRDWRKTVALEVMVLDRTGELTQANADLKRSNTALAKSMRELETFAYVASHDLREPLRAVSNYVSLIERRYAQQLDEDGLTFISYAREGAKRMNSLVLALLDYVDIGQQTRERMPFSLDEVVRVSQSSLNQILVNSGATVTIADQSPLLFADPKEIGLLLRHLMANAVHHRHPERPPHICITASLEEEGWVIAINDNGLGIAEEYFERIFGLYQRLNPRVDTGGVGTGLTVCRKIVDLYGGRIWVESTVGTGSSFKFTLPEAVNATQS